MLIASGMLALGGCAALIGLETSDTIAPDASIAEAGISDGEDPIDGDLVEASGVPCGAGARVSPTKIDAVVTSVGKTCGRPDAVLSADDLPFRLDYEAHGTEDPSWDGRYVTGCVGLGFQGGPFKALTVRARAVRSACGNECVGDACGTGQWFGVFVRSSGAQTPLWITLTPITSSFADYTVPLPPSVGVNPYLYVCRSSANRTRDDVDVDYVAACN